MRKHAWRLCERYAQDFGLNAVESRWQGILEEPGHHRCAAQHNRDA